MSGLAVKELLRRLAGKPVLTVGTVGYAGRGPLVPGTAAQQHQQQYTLGQLVSAVHARRHVLLQSPSLPRGQPPLRRGELVGLRMPSTYAALVDLLALWSLGAVAVPLGGSTPPAQVAARLASIGCARVLVSPSSTSPERRRADPGQAEEPAKEKGEEEEEEGAALTRAFQEVGAPLHWMRGASPSSASQSSTATDIADFAQEMQDAWQADQDHPLLVLFTSGSTGTPKGVLHTRRTIGASLTSLTRAWSMSSRDTCYNALPWHHVHGLVNALLLPLVNAARVVVMPRFSADELWQQWVREDAREVARSPTLPVWHGGGWVDAAAFPGGGVMMGVPTIYARLLEAHAQAPSPEAQAAQLQALHRFRVCISGSAPLDAELFHAWERLSGRCMLERYGMTETGMILGTGARADGGEVGARLAGRVGSPLPGVHVRLRPVEGVVASKSAGVGVGELCVAGEQVFPRYLNGAAPTSDRTPDGYFCTGDLVEHDPRLGGAEGSYRILGRLSTDILKVGGYKVSALEVERAITSMLPITPDQDGETDGWCIRECAVVGIPDPTGYGQVIGCVLSVARASGTSGTGETSPWRPHELEHVVVPELLRHLARQLSPYQLPRRWHVLQEQALPRNDLGKLDKRALARLFDPA